MKDDSNILTHSQEDNKLIRNLITLALIFKNYDLKIAPTTIQHYDSNDKSHNSEYIYEQKQTEKCVDLKWRKHIANEREKSLKPTAKDYRNRQTKKSIELIRANDREARNAEKQGYEIEF
jgi:hypothetical protein